MIPLNLYLDRATPEQVEHIVQEYGDAIRELAIANVFPGDMLWKNFGVTRHGKVVFYDYDEIEYLTDCHFRRVPAPRHEEDEMSGEVWYPVGPLDVFPEFAPPLVEIQTEAPGLSTEEVESLITIPLSLLAAGIVLHYLGGTINTMVLAGLVIAVGVLLQGDPAYDEQPTKKKEDDEDV